MATYTITVDDTFVNGLTEILANQNAQRRTQRQAPLADIPAMLAQATIGLAKQGIESLYQRHTLDIIQSLQGGATAADVTAIAQKAITELPTLVQAQVIYSA
jgi:CheY-specific phosphatase CheX